MNTMTWLQEGAAWAWHTSLVMAVPGLVLLALGRWRGFSARWRMVLAGALFARLLMPVVPELPGRPEISIERTLAESASVVVAPQAEERVVREMPERAAEGTAGVAFDSEAVRASTATTTRVSWQEIAAAIWALGVLGVAGWLMGSQWVLGRWVARQAVAPDVRLKSLFDACCERMGLERRVGLVELPSITTAAVWGWLRPVVLVPANLRETHTTDEIRGILLHELAHVKRWDVLWSWVGLAACALHWFNPLAWLALRRFHADRELDCDRMALANLTKPQRSAYAPALLKTLESTVFATPAALVPFFRNKHEIHTRILTIMKPAKSIVASLAAVLVIPALSILSLTKASADGEQGRTGPRDGEVRKDGPRDGETKREGARDGEVRKEGVRDGEARKEGARDGEVKKEGARDGDIKKEGARDGEARKTGERDGEMKREGARDGDVKKEGARDGEGTRKVGTRDGEGARKPGARDGEGARKSAEGDAPKGEAMVLKVLGNGEQVSVNGEVVSAGRLRGYLSEHLAGTGANVVVEAEDTVPYKAVMEVLDAARDNGAKGARLAANERGREGGKTNSAESR